MDETQLKAKYGLGTAISMVVGIVMGSGVFFKAETINMKTGGDLRLGILAWLIGGLVMMACVMMFAALSRKYQKAGGIADYAEATVGSAYAYYIGWFMATIYYPTLVSVLAWLSARYTMVLFGSADIAGGTCMTLACMYLIAGYAVNTLSPVLAGKIQVSTTILKLIPLVLMAVVGTIKGVSGGMIIENFSGSVLPVEHPGMALFSAVVAGAFAYEGWIVATAIGGELKNSRRNLPLALALGGLVVVTVYTLYYIGLAGAVPTRELMQEGAAGVQHAFGAVFGSFFASGLMGFIVISCLGTLNGLLLGCSRGLYSVAIRGRGPAPRLFSEIDPVTNMPTASAVMGLLLSVLWLFFFYGSAVREPLFGIMGFDSSELPIVTTYALYIPIFLAYLWKGRGERGVLRIILPIIGTLASGFMVVAAWYAHRESVFSYLIIFAAIMLIGVVFYKFSQGKK